LGLSTGWSAANARIVRVMEGTSTYGSF